MTITHLNPELHNGLFVTSFYVKEFVEQTFRGGRLLFHRGDWYILSNHRRLGGNGPYGCGLMGYSYSWGVYRYGTPTANVVDIRISPCPKEVE